MIPRDRFLSGLHELIYVEEGMVTMFANFSKALVAHTEDMEEVKKKEIRKMLSKLYTDSTKHKEMIDDLIRQIEADPRNEY
jgi:hypothetical protein